MTLKDWKQTNKDKDFPEWTNKKDKEQISLEEIDDEDDERKNQGWSVTTSRMRQITKEWKFKTKIKASKFARNYRRTH